LAWGYRDDILKCVGFLAISMKAKPQLVARDHILPIEVEEEIAKWEQARARSVLSDHAATNALKILFWKGCDPVRILEYLELYCQTSIGRERPELSFAARALSLSKRLVDDAKHCASENSKPNKDFCSRKRPLPIVRRP
jgi:hypothetical protein